MRRLLRLVYDLRLRRPYRVIDRLHYLKRLHRGKKAAHDEWYYSDKDIAQYREGQVLIRSIFRDRNILFLCNPRSHVERQIIRDGLYAPHILHFMVEFLRPHTSVIDVGANVGAYSVPLATAFPDIQVHAFEPHPLAIERFQRNVFLNKAANIRLHPVGVGETSGIREFYMFDAEDVGSSSFVKPSTDDKRGRSVPLTVVALDDFFEEERQKVSVIKIDVQGYEAGVLKGARTIIARDRPPILLEHEDKNFSTKKEAAAMKNDLRDFFSANCYAVFYMTRYDPYMLFPVDWDRSLNGNLLALPECQGSEARPESAPDCLHSG